MRRYFPKFLIRPPPSTPEEKVIHWNLCRTWHELSVHYNKKGGIEMEKTVSNLRNISKLGFFSLSDSCEEKCWNFFCSNIYILCLLTCLLASLPDEGEEFFKINFSVPISVYLAKQPSHLCAQKIVTRFSQRWTILINAQLSLTRGIKFLYALASFDSKL